MKSAAKASVVFCLALLLTARSHGETAEEKKAFETLMRLKKMISESINGKEAPGSKSTVFAMVMPGIGIHEKRDGSDNSSVTMPAWVLNTLPSTDLSGNTSSTNITEIYRRCLFDSVLKNPVSEDKLKDDAAKISGIDDQIRPMSEAYRARQDAYSEAVANYATALKLHGPSSAEAIKAKNAKSSALMAWSINGFKDTVENLQRQKAELTLSGAEPWALWKSRFDKATNNATDPSPDQDFEVMVYPEYPSWTEKSGWISMEFGGSHMKNYTVQRSFSGSASGGWGFLGFGGGASGNYSKSSDISESAADSMSFKMEVKRILIYRAWGDPLLFRSVNWKWKDPAMNGNPATMISQGKYDKEKDAFLGLMPLYPTSLILARNIEVTAKFSTEDKQHFSESMSGSAKGGFLCFRASASASSSTTSSLEEKGDGFATIKIPDPQIIGYICDVLPACPVFDKKPDNPDLGGLDYSNF